MDVTGYVGLIAVIDISQLPMPQWSNVTARQVVRTDVAPAAPTETVEVAADRMRAANGEAMAVMMSNTLRDLSNIEVLLDRRNNEAS